MRGVPGTTCKLYLDLNPDYPERPGPEEGDFVLTRTGTCYRIDSVRRAPRRAGRFYLGVTRLERNAVLEGEPGVWMIYWYSRSRNAGQRSRNH